MISPLMPSQPERTHRANAIGDNGEATVRAAGGQQTEKLGYLGLGLMGLPMTRRLLDAGYDVAVWNRSPGKVSALVEAGAKATASPREVAAHAGIVFMCLTDAAAVEDVVFGTDGLSSVPGEGKLVVDFSSIHPDAARAIATRLKAANGMHWIDAPVSGGTKGAEEATLAIMAGGDASVIAQLNPVFAAMGTARHVGPVGSGQLAKLANQLIVAVSITGLPSTRLLMSEATVVVVAALVTVRLTAAEVLGINPGPPPYWAKMAC